MPYLYHVTTQSKARKILKTGLEKGYTTSEFEPSVAAAEEETGLDRDDPEFWDEAGDYDQLPSEMEARERFNEILREVAPRKLPDHEDSLFFWTSEDQANMNASMMQNKPLNTDKYVVLKVDKEDLPCQCYGASTNEAEMLFDDILDHSGEWSPAPSEEDEDRFYEEAEAYYNGMKPWDGQKDEDIEVLCPCHIPAKVIKKAL